MQSVLINKVSYNLCKCNRGARVYVRLLQEGAVYGDKVYLTFLARTAAIGKGVHLGADQ